MKKFDSYLPSALAALAVLFAPGDASAQKKKDAAEKPAKKGAAVVRGLTNPCGLAVQPGTGHLFVASVEGITRFNPATGDSHLEIAYEGNDVYGKGPMYDIGPLGLAFLGEKHLVVGGGGTEDPKELVRVFEIHDEEGDHEPFAEDSAAFTLGPQGPEEGVTAKGEGNYYGVAVGAGKIFVTANGDDTKGWIMSADVVDGKPGKLKPGIASKVATDVDAPVPALFHDGLLWIGQMGEVNVPGDSLLTAYDPKTGKLVKSYETGLNDIAGIAVSKEGKIYATDFSWVDPAAGALFELVIEGDECEARKIRKLDKPTALAFGADGTLYVAIFGTPKEGAKKPSGRVLGIKKGL